MFLSSYVCITLVVIALILLYRHLTRNFNYWKNRKVPYVKPAVLFGNIYEVCRVHVSISQFLCNIYHSTNSPYLGFFVFDQPFLLIRDPEVIKQCLIKNFDHLYDRTVTINMKDDELGSSVLFSLRNPAWRHIRTQLTPVFTSGKIKNMLPLMKTVGDDLVDYLERVGVHERNFDAREVCIKYTVDVISSCAFGINAECFKHEDAAFRNAARRVFDFNFGRKIQMASYFFAPMMVDFLKMKFMEPEAGKFMRNVFTSTMAQREQSNFHRGDLIDILIEIRRKSKETAELLDGTMLVAQAVVFFNAGFETTATTISFTLYQLSLNPQIQNRLRKEIHATLGKHEGVTYEAISDMTYLDMVVSETLRMYPPLAFLDRRCNTTHELPGTDLVIEKGIPIYISLLGLHSDPQYFPNPEKYDPERFTPENKRNRPSSCYLPFGDGPRNCIGARFGLLSAKTALTRIINEFIVEPSELTPMPLTLDPNGMLLSPAQTLYLHFKKVPDDL